MDYRKMFSEWHKAQVAENANPYPTGVQGFQGGVEAERARIIALLEEASEKWRDTDYDAHYGAEACLELLKGEN